MQIKNITVQQYLSLNDSTLYDSIIPFIKEKNLFKGSKFNVSSLTYDDVAILRKLLSNINSDSLGKVYSICYKEYVFSGLFNEYVESFKYITQQIKQLNEREEKLLKGTTDVKLISAGIDKLKKFGTLNTKIDLAQQFCKSPNEIGKWKYHDVLVLQVYNQTVKSIQKNIK